MEQAAWGKCSITPAPTENLAPPTPTLISLREGTVLASAGVNAGDFALHLWDVVNNQSLGTREGHDGIIWDVAFSPDGELPASVSADGTIVATATCITVMNDEYSQGNVWLWNLPTGKLIGRLSDFPSVVERVAFTTDGSNRVAGSRDGTLRFYPATSYVPLLGFLSPGGVSAMAVSPDGGLPATGNSSRDVYVWKNVYHP